MDADGNTTPGDEDTYTFDLGSVHFTISCHRDDYSIVYAPKAELGAKRAYGCPIIEPHPYFEALRFSSPPAWLIEGTAPYSTIHERPRGRGIQGSDPELVVVLLCVEEVRQALSAWAASHPFIG